jgi:hypothetical protein
VLAYGRVHMALQGTRGGTCAGVRKVVHGLIDLQHIGRVEHGEFRPASPTQPSPARVSIAPSLRSRPEPRPVARPGSLAHFDMMQPEMQCIKLRLNTKITQSLRGPIDQPASYQSSDLNSVARHQ